MLLQQLTLSNIRSYSKETIKFSPGSSLLAGDIGAGKSSLLLAIEFALFGISRPDLPAEALLRKGSSNGSVELKFILDQQQVTIQRNLKKDNDSIKQTVGHIIINDSKKELTAVELKAEVLGLLGYPPELVNKNKNYIFRYTVYTPQEGMKLILQENPPARQEVLRIIFNIEKYQKIRENIQIYLRQMRTDIAILKVKIKPLEEERELLRRIIAEKAGLQLNLKVRALKLQEIQEQREGLQKEIENLENQQRLFLELKQQQETIFALICEKEKLILDFEQNDELITLKIADLRVPIGRSLQEVKLEIKEIEAEKDNLIGQKTSLLERVNLLQLQIAEGRQEIIELESSLLNIKDKEEEVDQLRKFVTKKDYLSEEKKKLEKFLEHFSTILIKNNTLAEQALEIQIKISSLENCPTCLQAVTTEHKHKITSQQQKKITTIRKMLKEMEGKKKEIEDNGKTIETELGEIIKKENLLIKIETELQQLKGKAQTLSKKRENLLAKVQENNSLMKQLSQLDEKNDLSSLEVRRKELQEIFTALNQKQFLETQAQELTIQIIHNRGILAELKAKLQEVTLILRGKSDSQQLITEKKTAFSRIINAEKESAVIKAGLQAQLISLISQERELQLKTEKLAAEKNQLVRLQEFHHWLEDFFLPLTNTIEKQVMVNIHHLFNQLFKEWFSTLIDDDEIDARIDDSYTPVIEQNGYEIQFANLSGGEKTSAALAYRLALNRVINDVIHNIKTKDLLILDEPTDGFSTEQLEKVRVVLDLLQLQQTIIVSHESKIESFVENVIRIGKKGQVSSVIYT